MLAVLFPCLERGFSSMCLAVPAKITEISTDDRAWVEVGGARHEVSLALVPNAQVGDYVLVHVGFALVRLDTEEALRTLALFDEYRAVGKVAEQGGDA